MADQESGFFVPIIAAFTGLISWGWAAISGQKKEIEKLSDKISDHERHVSDNHPTTPQMRDALNSAIAPIKEKLDLIDVKVDNVSETVTRERDNELQRLRSMAEDRRKN